LKENENNAPMLCIYIKQPYKTNTFTSIVYVYKMTIAIK